MKTQNRKMSIIKKRLIMSGLILIIVICWTIIGVKVSISLKSGPSKASAQNVYPGYGPGEGSCTSSGGSGNCSDRSGCDFYTGKPNSKCWGGDSCYCSTPSTVLTPTILDKPIFLIDSDIVVLVVKDSLGGVGLFHIFNSSDLLSADRVSVNKDWNNDGVTNALQIAKGISPFDGKPMIAANAVTDVLRSSRPMTNAEFKAIFSTGKTPALGSGTTY